MESKFDQMTKVLAEGIPRREALWRLTGLFGGAVLAALGWGNKVRADNTASDCAHFCNDNFPGGQDREECKRQCRACGGPSRLCFGPPGTVPVCCPDHLTCCCGVCIQGTGVCCGTRCCPAPANCCVGPPTVPPVCCPPPAICCPIPGTNFTKCTNISSDPNNCGDCNHKCPIDPAGNQGVCCNGQCCAPGQTCCNGKCCPAGDLCCPTATDGPICVDVSSNPNDCGACGVNCGTAGGVVVPCCGGKCCAAPLTCCFSTVAGAVPVCTDTRSDPNNCGNCGAQCPPSATAPAVCCNGACCGAGQLCCPNSANVLVCTNACNGQCCSAPLVCCANTCANLLTDPNNCGTCGRVCPPIFSGAPGTCVGGVCV